MNFILNILNKNGTSSGINY